MVAAALFTCLIPFSAPHAHDEDAPYRPKSGREVVITLPYSGPEAAQIYRHRRSNMAAPGDIHEQISLARLYLDLAATTGEHRYTDIAAELLVSADTDRASKPFIEWRLLQAVIAERQHKFVKSISLLTDLLRDFPQHSGALFRRGALNFTLGHMQEALADCLSLFNLKPDATSAGCLAQALSATGQAPAARDLLLKFTDRNRTADAWAWGVLADIQARLGDSSAAGQAYRHALNLTDRKSASRLPLIEAAAWFFFHRQKSADARAIIADAPDTPAIQLLKIATRPSNTATTQPEDQIVQQLAERLKIPDDGGTSSHPEYLILFALHVEKKPERALTLSRNLWEQRKTPETSRLYAGAAAAAGAKTDLRIIAQWMADLKAKDARLQSALDLIES